MPVGPVALEMASLKSKGEEISKEKEEELFNRIKKKYDDQTSPYYAAARLWVDAIIDPVQTRKWISIGIAASDQNEDIKSYKVGVIQT